MAKAKNAIEILTTEGAVLQGYDYEMWPGIGIEFRPLVNENDASARFIPYNRIVEAHLWRGEDLVRCSFYSKLPKAETYHAPQL